MISFAHKFLDMQNIDLILAVPLHNRKQRQRQFNQVQILAQSLAGAFSKNAPAKLIIKTKSAPAQASLSRTERLKSIRDSLKVKQANLVKDKRILLVDDVLTTGATANECAKVLQEAGAKRIEVFTLARGI